MTRARKTAEPPRPKGPTVVVVQRRGHGVPELVFADRAAADAHRRELDRAARACSDPFEDAPAPEKLASDGGSGFWEALTALGCPPPAPGQEWWEWWGRLCADTTAEQRDALWDAFDEWHAYDVVEVPLED